MSCFVSFIAVVFIGSVDITIFFFGKGGGGGREEGRGLRESVALDVVEYSTNSQKVGIEIIDCTINVARLLRQHRRQPRLPWDRFFFFARLTLSVCVCVCVCVSSWIHNGLLWFERFLRSFLFILYAVSGQFTFLYYLSYLFRSGFFIHMNRAMRFWVVIGHPPCKYFTRIYSNPDKTLSKLNHRSIPRTQFR